MGVHKAEQGNYELIIIGSAPLVSLVKEVTISRSIMLAVPQVELGLF